MTEYENPQLAWDAHVQDATEVYARVEYSRAMALLARSPRWTILDGSSLSRLTWCVSVLKTYYAEGGLRRALEKDQRRRIHQSLVGGLCSWLIFLGKMCSWRVTGSHVTACVIDFCLIYLNVQVHVPTSFYAVNMSIFWNT